MARRRPVRDYTQTGDPTQPSYSPPPPKAPPPASNPGDPTLSFSGDPTHGHRTFGMQAGRARYYRYGPSNPRSR